MMKHAAIAFAAVVGFGATSLPCDAQSSIQHVPLKKSLDSSVNHGFTLYFRTINYSSMVCTDPRIAADADLIISGSSLYDDPQADAKWLNKQKTAGNCWQQPPNERFTVTSAYPVYLNDAMVSWVVGVTVPSTGKIIGYIPQDEIQLIPIPTL